MIYPFEGKRLVAASANHYIAPGARIIGDVHLGDWASIWFNAVLRADDTRIVIGDGSNIQDGTVIHGDTGQHTLIGRNVTIGHRVLLHGCRVDDDSLVGNGAVVLDGVHLARNCFVAAGSLVTPGKVFPEGSVIMGSPARIVRQVGEKELAMIAHGARSYRLRVQRFLAEPALGGPGT